MLKEVSVSPTSSSSSVVWTCDSCQTGKSSFEERWRCADCDDFDQCGSCRVSGVTHPHPLRRVTGTPLWSCDHCQRSSHDLPQGTRRLRCHDCTDFDLCSFCAEAHELRHVTSASGRWFCDECRASRATADARYRCGKCADYDKCESCFQRDRSCRVHTQVTLKFVTGAGTWYCDRCQKWNNGERYRCYDCRDFDYCGDCFQDLQGLLAPRGGMPRPVVTVVPPCDASTAPGFGDDDPFPTEAPVPDASAFRLTVKTLTGRTISIVASSTDTVHILKLRVRDQEGIPPDQMRLVFAGVNLDSARTLADYNIQPDATLHLILALRG